MPVGDVSCELVASAMRERGKTPRDVAVALGWRDRKGSIDTSRVNRMLGLRERAYGRQKLLTLESADRFLTAIGATDALPEIRIASGAAEQRCRSCGEPMQHAVPDGRCGFCVEEEEAA